MCRKKVVKKDDIASAIYENAIDSLGIGMEFFLKEDSYSSRKHAAAYWLTHDPTGMVKAGHGPVTK